jgi:hypothetical protein
LEIGFEPVKKPFKKKPKVIKANQILVEDLEGRPRILLDATDGRAGISITLFSKSYGDISLSINDENHAVVSLNHPDGKSGVCLGVKADGQSGLVLSDNNGSPSITLQSKAKDRKPEIEIRTKTGKKQLV